MNTECMASKSRKSQICVFAVLQFLTDEMLEFQTSQVFILL